MGVTMCFCGFVGVGWVIVLLYGYIASVIPRDQIEPCVQSCKFMVVNECMVGLLSDSGVYALAAIHEHE